MARGIRWNKASHFMEVGRQQDEWVQVLVPLKVHAPVVEHLQSLSSKYLPSSTAPPARIKRLGDMTDMNLSTGSLQLAMTSTKYGCLKERCVFTGNSGSLGSLHTGIT